jgi:DNA polymerase-3 subunit delta'
LKPSDNQFDIIAAQPRAWSILSRSFLNDRVASTYLFSGPYGAGHWAMTLAFTSLLNCEQPIDDIDGEGNRTVRPCRVCRHCRAIAHGNFEGFFPVVPLQPYKKDPERYDQINAYLERRREDPLALPDEEKSVYIRIEAARDIKHRLSRRATEGQTRVVLFDRMERARPDAADSLLKMIEEPPPRTVIILTAERPDSLLPTIQSRAQMVRLSRVPEKLISGYLQERYELSERRAILAARLSEGLPGRAVLLADVDATEEGSTRSLGWLIFKLLFQPGGGEVMQVVYEQLAPRGLGDIEQVLELWQSLIRDCAYYAVVGDGSGLTNVDFEERLIALSRPFEFGSLAEEMTAEIKNTLADLRRNVHIHTALAALVIKLRSAIRRAEHGAAVA